MSRDSVQNNNMVSSGKEELPICAEPLPTTSNVLQREQHETLGASTHKPFDLMKDGGDLISAILGQKAEDQIPNFRGGAAEYPAWEEAIAPIRYCSFRQPIMKFNAIKKSLSGEALEIVKWIGLDQPDPVETLVDALKKEYGRQEIVIRAQEVRLEKLASPKEDDYPTQKFCDCCEEHHSNNESTRYWHHPLLHHQRRTKEEESSASDQTEKSYICNDSAHHLELLKVFLRGPRKTILTTALIDSGCSRTFVDEDLAKDLGLKVKTAAMILQGFHGAKNVEAARVSLDIAGLTREWYSVSNATTLKKLRIPGGEVKWADWAKDQPKFAKLPLENVSYADVRILLGQDVKELTENVCTMKVKSDDKKYAAYRCKLGWTISGPRLPSDKEAVMYCCIINNEVDHGTVLLQEFRNFNSLEGLGITDKSIGLSRRETDDLEHMQNGTVVFSDGRFQIPMLWKCPGGVPPSEEQAKRRLISLQKKLRLNPRLGELYEKSIQDDKAKGYIRRLSPMEAADLRKRRHWFLPHFAVFHPDKADKCRRVLDAAARNGGVSLNSLLNTGPNLITLLLGVLVRFRCGRIAVNADVKEMFSQVAVPPADSDMLAFLWTSSVHREPDVYVNQRHVFGATCSPAVANFALREAVKRKDAAIAQIVNEAFYMDDLYWSDDNEDVVIQRSQELKTAFREACFELSKWVSNSRKVIETWPMKERACWNRQHPVTKATVGYESVAYLAQGMTTAFVAAKSRVVNPLKTTTVPRLELQAFIVGVRLADTLLKELENRLVIGRVVFWSDSLVVLYWINSDENRYLPFVSNRLREINETLQSCRFKDRHVEVRYVPSKENPADLISRGMDATGLIKRFDFWTTGPKFLKREEEWPETKVKPPDNDLELRPKAIAFFVGSNSADADKCSTVAEFLKQRQGKDTLNCEDFDREEKKIIKEVFRSNDGYVRSAMLKTANGKELVRDIRRISIMEGPALERMKMPVVPPASGGVSHPELVKSIELTTTNSEARNESNIMQI
ncbi:hypothetical protein Tsp_04928 [Trichinella spiralis]|uniref:hypothetical protein n=1 Tax=Trichinella spiralis TaxID=6334 RepID=UPI0001EFE57B|nr:hypothetical protein Tsp_04928 [Trichinella spiralis]